MSIHILHPYFTVAFIMLIIMGYRSLSIGAYIRNKHIWWVIGFLTILAGFRVPMVDDKAYLIMYNEFGSLFSFNLKNIREDVYGIEWLYVLYNQILYVMGLPFSVLVILTAIFTISIKYRFFENNSPYPALSFLMYMIPTYFSGDIGHMRQSIATGIVFVSFYAIKHRKWWIFLPLMYLAKGFHNSSVIFLFAYWIAVFPLNRWKMLIIVGTCIILSPFNVYEQIPILNSIAPDDVMQGFENYSEIVEENTGTIKFGDLVSLFYLYFMVTYDKEACEKIPYYEYMRNLTVAGICIYFIFRSSPIFSTRLVSYYFLFGTITIPSIIASIQNINLRRGLFSLATLYIVFYFFVFATMQGRRAYSPSTYSNWLIGG